MREGPGYELGCDLFIRKPRNVRSLACVLNGYAADVAVLVEIENGVFVEVFRLNDFRCFELDVQSVGVLKVFNVHGVNDRSKKAL